MNCSPPSDLERLAAALAAGLRCELYLTPKPGLVDLFDNGSHPDLCPQRMLLSVRLVEDGFRRMAARLAAGGDLAQVRAVGRELEQRMLDRLGTNTHKGAIFLGGLLLVARHRAGCDAVGPLRLAICAVARELFESGAPSGTNGGRARSRFGVGGIVAEALAGLPALFDDALPAYREGVMLGGEGTLPAFLVMARLMQSVEDTTTLHRGGPAGLKRLQRDGRRLEAVLRAGLEPWTLLRQLNDRYRRLNLTMGGVADLLGATYAWLAHTADFPVLQDPVPLTRSACCSPEHLSLTASSADARC